MSRIPEMRFEGFTEPWEQRKVTELLKNSSSAMKIGPFGSALKKEYFVEEGIKVYAQENAFTGDFSMGDYYITEDKYKELKSCELYPGDLVISMMGTIGACAIFPKNAEKGIMNSHLLRLQFNNEVIPEYIMYLLRDSVLIRKQIDRLSVGSIMSGLSSSVVKKLVFPIPKLAEQKRIVEYLDSIDRLITLHQRKYDRLKNLKKAYLEKMFPKDGETVPEMRFEGFTEPWEQRKLGELGSLKNGMNFSKEAMGVGYPFVNLQNIFGNNVIDVSDLGKAMASDSQLKDYNLINGDVLFVRSSVKLEGVGEAALVPQTLENTTYSGFIIRFRDEYGLDNNFKRFVFGIDSVRNQIMSQATNSANKNIIQSVLENLELAIPSKSEQQKIGAYFSNLDYLITLHQHKLERLKHLKQAYLQKMFA